MRQTFTRRLARRLQPFACLGACTAAALSAILLLAPAPAEATAYTPNCVGCHLAPPLMPETGTPRAHILNNFAPVDSNGTTTDSSHLKDVVSHGWPDPDPHVAGMPAIDPNVSDDDVKSLFDLLVSVRDGNVLSLSAAFDDTVIGQQSASRYITITNARRTATAIEPVVFSGDFALVPSTAADHCKFSVADALPAGGSCRIDLTFSPSAGAVGQRIGSVTVKLAADHGLTATGKRKLDLSANALAPSPPKIKITPPADGRGGTFPNTRVNTSSASRQWTIGNEGDLDLKLSSLSQSGATAFVLGSPACSAGASLAKNGSCALPLSFTPNAAQAYSGQITIAHNDGAAGNSSVISFSGTGVDPELQLSAVTPGFLRTLVGHPQPASQVTISNVGSADAVLGTLSITQAGQAFAVASNCDGKTLPSGSSTGCSVALSLSPVAAGNLSGRLDVPYAGRPEAQLALSATVLQLATDPLSPTVVTPRGTAATVSVTLKNPSEVDTFLGPIVLKPGSFSQQSSNCPSTLGKASSCSIVVSFTPPSVGDSVAGSMKVSYGPSLAANAAQSIEVPLLGSIHEIPMLRVDPSKLDFPATPPRQWSNLTLTLSNIGSAELLLLKGVDPGHPNVSTDPIAIVADAGGDFSIVRNTCGASIPVGKSCDLTVAFTANSDTQPPTATLQVTHNAVGSPTKVALNGVILRRPLAQLSPLSLDFGETVLGTSSAGISATLSNPGNLVLHLGAIEIFGANPAEFIEVPGGCTSHGSVEPGKSCVLTRRFVPLDLGARSAMMQITDDAAGGTLQLSLSGRAVPAPAPDIATTPTWLEFERLPIGGASAVQAFDVRNTGSLDLHVSRIAISGSAAGDYATGGSCSAGVPLVPNASCSIAVTFRPSAPSGRAAELRLESDASRGTVSLALRGFGSGEAAPSGSLSLSADRLDFGRQRAGGMAPARTITLRNSGSAPLHVMSAQTSGAYFSGQHDCWADLSPGASCHVTVRFAAQGGQPGVYDGEIDIVTDASRPPRRVMLRGEISVADEAVLQWMPPDPPEMDFGMQPQGGSSPPRSIQLSNQGPRVAQIASIVASGSDAQDFSAGGSCLGTSLWPGNSCSVELAFAPHSAGPKLAGLQVVLDGTPPSDLALSGIGMPGPGGGLVLYPGPLDFGTIATGTQSPPQPLTLRNGGMNDLHVTSLQMNGPFGVTPLGCGGLPILLRQGQECQLNLAFTPDAAGVATGTLVIGNDSDEAAALLATSGNAVAAPALKLSLESVDFGAQKLGQSSPPRSITLSNNGRALLHFAGISTVDAGGAFEAHSDCGPTLLVGATCQVSVVFHPQSIGPNTQGRVLINSDVPGWPRTIDLAGQGVP